MGGQKHETNPLAFLLFLLLLLFVDPPAPNSVLQKTWPSIAMNYNNN